MKSSIQNIKENYKLVIGVLITGLLLGWLFFHSSDNQRDIKDTTELHEGHDHESEDPTTWTCSMHPQIKQDKPGDCPICGMDLIPLESMDSGDEGFDPNEVMLSEAAAKLADIQTTEVKRGTPVKKLYLQGKVEADERNLAELTARFGGRIEKLYVNFTGERVQKGEKLASIYSPELLSAQRELIETVALKENRPALYKAAKNKLKLWDLTDAQIAQIERLGEPMQYFDILSPISGTIMKRHVALGDYVKEGNPLFMVVNLSEVWVMFDAYEDDLPWINKGDKIEFTVQSLPGKTYTENVTFVDPFIDPKTRSAKVRVEIPNSDRKLKPAMFAKGILYSEIAKNTNQLIIPKSSVLWTGKRSVVYVKVPERENPTFLYREIILGPEAGNFYVVESGLAEGEVIATNGVFKIDASAQLEGKTSMMSPASAKATAGKPSGGGVPAGHDHGSMDMGTKEKVDQDDNLKHEMFKVAGNCSMCKDRIETTANGLSGVNSAEWNQDSQMLHIAYDPDKIKISKIHKAIAAAGHDTELERAPDDVYNELPGCCQFERLTYDNAQIKLTSAEFHVSGNCGMCKDRIEKATLSVDGVRTVNWNQETEMLTVEYDQKKTKELNIHQAIAEAGHDTEKVKADDEVYDNLPGCCLYRESE